MRVRTFSPALYAAVYGLTLLEAFLPHPVVTGAATVAFLGFVTLEIGNVRPAQRLAAGVLVSLGLGTAYAAGGLAALERVAARGIHDALPFLVLFAAVMSLQAPAFASPAFRAIGEAVVRQPPGRRYMMLAFAGHYLGAVLNLAGFQLVASFFDPTMAPVLRQRLTIAVVRGFSAAVLWSPFFVGMGVILTVLPEVSWLTLLPAGLPMGAGLILLARAFDRLTSRQPRPAPAAAAVAPGPPATRSAHPAIGVATVFLALAGPVIALSEGAGLPIVIALGLAAPPLALLWHVRLRLGDPGVAPTGSAVRDLYARLPGLRNEAVLFLGATVLGIGLADAVHDQMAGGWAGLAALPGWLAGGVLTLLGTLLGGLGVHPVVPAILVGAVLQPAALGLPATALALILAVVWGLGTQMSPFSATVMAVARLLDVSVFRVAWRWNAPFCTTAAVLFGMLIGVGADLLAGFG